MSVIIRCNNCEETIDKSKTLLERSDIKVQHKFIKMEKDFNLLYFRCPHCKHLYQILPMDELASSLHKQLEELAERFARINKRGGLVPDALKIKATRIKRKLGNHYDKINHGYQGMPYQLGDESHVLDIIKIPGITGEENPK